MSFESKSLPARISVPSAAKCPSPIENRFASDYLTIADAAGVDRFVAVGYSWSANAALQVASRTERCAGLALGGWPPLSGPYAELLELVTGVVAQLEEDSPQRPFMQIIANYYNSIVGSWDEEAAVTAIKGPRLAFFGS